MQRKPERKRTLFTELGGQMQRIALLQLLISHLIQEITRVQNLEEQFVTLLAVFAHEGSECFHRRSLYLLEAVELVHAADGVEDIVALGHLQRGEVARAFGNTWFHLFFKH